MKKRNIYIIFTFLCLPLIAIVLWSLFFKSEPTNYNISSIPKNCNDYLIINTSKINNEISSYFLKNPSLLLKVYENTSSFKAEFEEVDFIFNEPISIFWDERNQIIVAYLSIKNLETINPEKYELEEIKKDDLSIYCNKSKNTLYFRDENKNQLKIFFSNTKINSKVINDTFISKYLIDDTSNYNSNALFQYESSDNSIIFNGENSVLKELGVSHLKGSIELNQDKISLSIEGENNDKFIFKDLDSLITIDDNWMNFSANFNTASPMFSVNISPNIKNIWDGKFSIGLNELKSTNGLMSLNNLSELLNIFNFSILIGNSNNEIIDSINSSYGNFNQLRNQKGLFLSNQKKLVLNYGKADYFNLNIDIEKLLSQEINDFSWSGIKMVLKKINLKEIKINCFKHSNNSFNLTGNINSSDSTKHILLSPFIY